MSTDTRPLMASIGRTTVAEILGDYESLLDAKHDLEIEELAANLERWLDLRRDLNDIDRSLWIYQQLATEAGRLIGAEVPA